MRSFSVVWNTTIIQKWVMAITGICLVVFLLAHLSGNLLVFLGPEHMNAYGVELREMFHGAAIWVVRLGLIVALILHVLSGIKLARLNRGAKAVRNDKVEHRTSTIASRSMIYTGLLVVVYVVYHLAHFTWGVAHGEYYHVVDHLGRHDVYRMVVDSFHQPLITITYVIAMIVTGLHLNHAISSALQTLGINHPRYTPMLRLAGPALGMLIVIGFLSIPLGIMFGLVK
ncbi:MAG: succinate dehydrogenase cytochrome b subunit [Bradyrhizobiaceae bacterium]|nr:succinate dehydrogenase cytochrome b subunit [Bradyrhizobiaceae bacterium]